jgi:hypothetical protein
MVLTRTVVPDYHHLQCSYIHGARRQGAVLVQHAERCKPAYIVNQFRHNLIN